MIVQPFAKNKIALAVMLLLSCGVAQAQVKANAPNNLTCDAPNLAIDPVSHLPEKKGVPQELGGALLSPLANTVHSIKVEVQGLADSKGLLAADGMSQIPVTIRVFDRCGQPVTGRLVAKVNSGALRIQNTGTRETVGQRLGVDEVELTNGVGQLILIAPSVQSDVPISVEVGHQEAKGKISFAPDLRPLIAAGLIDGVINLGGRSHTLVPPAGFNDSFERELKRFQREFASGDVSLAGRAAFFVKGMIKGDTLLTASFDSEKEKRDRILQNINPDKYYPVLGDSSLKGMEARSADRFYVRLDNGKNYVLYGDFATGDGFSQQLGGHAGTGIKMRNLGQYNRTMTGLRSYRTDGQGFLDTFVMRDSLRQSVEEYRGNGTSGPYSVANLYAVENTEKLEVIVRDRNNTSRILSVTHLIRFVDYTFEPFSGRILLKAPLASLDEALNPISLRITYEVDTQGEPFWVYGAFGQRKINERVEIGGSYVRDENPTQPIGGAGYPTVPGQGLRELRELLSANVGVKVTPQSYLVLETAKSTSATAVSDIDGQAYRLDWVGKGQWSSPWGDGLKWDTRVFGGLSDKNFHNPAASFTGGRSEGGIRSTVELSKATRVLLDAVYTEDQVADTKRNAESVRIEHKLDERWTLDAGVRHVYQTPGAVLSFSSAASNLNLPGQASAYSGSGLNPSGAGFWGLGTGLNPITGQPQSMLNGQIIPGSLQSPGLDAWTVRGGATYRYTDRWSIGAEVGRDMGLNGDPYWVAANTQYLEKNWRAFGRIEAPTGRATAGGDYKITENTSIYTRFENTNGLASSYALDSAAKSQAFVLGVRQTDGKGLENFSEYRMRDAMDGQQIENATGLRNTFPILPGLRGNLSAERLKVMGGGGRSASALGGGLEWTEDDWRGSARLEWRGLDRTASSSIDDSAQSWMNTLSLARKLDPSWTALFRNYLLFTDQNHIAGYQLQNRFQVGAAYRPIQYSRLDSLMRYENKFEQNQELASPEKRTAHILSTNVNYHPSRPWWYMGRVAGKTVNEQIQGLGNDYQAWLLSGRVLYDITKDFDLGVMASVLGSPQGDARQYAYGLEGGYLLDQNIWVSIGYNLAGFSDRDLTGSDYTRKGIYLRLRVKFDEKSIQRLSNNVKGRFVQD